MLKLQGGPQADQGLLARVLVLNSQGDSQADEVIHRQTMVKEH